MSSARKDVGGSVEKLLGLAALSLEVVRRGYLTRWLLSRLVGAWVHHLCFRRAGFCLLNAVFTWSRARDVSQHRWSRLPSSVCDELLSVSCLWPLWRTSLDAGLSRRILASDATLSEGCVATAPLDREEAVWLYSRLPRRGGSVVVGRDDSGERTFLSSGTVVHDVLLGEFVRGCSFKNVCTYPFRKQAHINVQEAVAYRTLLKHAAKSSDLQGTRCPVLLDSRVVQQVALRGRSSSSQLNSIFLRALPYILFSNLYPMCVWVPSAENPADDGSRGKKVRANTVVSEVVAKSIEEARLRFPWASQVEEDRDRRGPSSA